MILLCESRVKFSTLKGHLTEAMLAENGKSHSHSAYHEQHGTIMKYVDTKALDRLFGKIMPFTNEYISKNIELILRQINSGQKVPKLARASNVLLASNKANKDGTWSVCKDFDFDIVFNYTPHDKSLTSGGRLETNLLVDSKANAKLPKQNWCVLFHLNIGNRFDGTPWQITFPIQMVMKHYPHKTKDKYSGYCHAISLTGEDNLTEHEYFYVGITGRNWLQRMSEHFREINSGSDKSFHKAWRNHVGKRNVVLRSELVVDHHTYDEIMNWEEKEVDRNMGAGVSLNMIPGGFKGMRHLHELRLTNSPQISLKERDRVVQEYQKEHPRAGIPNLLISELWADEAWAEKATCAAANRLSPDQVRAIRALGENGLPPEEIAKQVGARNVRQVKGVLSGDNYKIVR